MGGDRAWFAPVVGPHRREVSAFAAQTARQRAQRAVPQGAAGQRAAGSVPLRRAVGALFDDGSPPGTGSVFKLMPSLSAGSGGGASGQGTFPLGQHQSAGFAATPRRDRERPLRSRGEVPS